MLHHEQAVGKALSARRGALFIVLWAFGFATTVLLIGLWGRATSADEGTLAQTAVDMLTAEEVEDRFFDFVGDGLASAEGLDANVVGAVFAKMNQHPEARNALNALIAQTVTALFAQPGSAVEIDVSGSLEPLIPIAIAELQQRGIEVPEAAIRDSIAEVDALGIEPAAYSIVEVTHRVQGLLTWVVVLGLLGLAVSGSLATVLAEDRVAMARNLAIRVALSAASFALLFQFGGWILDPDGGRTPLATGGSTLIRSNGHVFVIVAAVASGVVASVTLMVRRRRTERPAPAREPDTDDTRELVAV